VGATLRELQIANVRLQIWEASQRLGGFSDGGRAGIGGRGMMVLSDLMN
jgi:hypothetical protein